ncbi:trp operon leader peptide [Citrobacter sp. CK198]
MKTTFVLHGWWRTS